MTLSAQEQKDLQHECRKKTKYGICYYHYFNDDLSLAEIAENEGITRQGVNDLIKRAEAQLAEMEEKCHYCEYFWSLKSLGEDFRQGKENAIDEILEIIEKL